MSHHGEVPPLPADRPDHAALADWIVRNRDGKNRNDATPPLVGLVFALGWPPLRVHAAVEAGVSAGSLREWPGDPAGPSVTLSEAEADRRGLRIQSRGMAKGGRFLFRWVDIDAEDPQIKGGMRLKGETQIALTAELRYGGNAKVRPSKVPDAGEGGEVQLIGARLSRRRRISREPSPGHGQARGAEGLAAEG